MNGCPLSDDSEQVPREPRINGDFLLDKKLPLRCDKYPGHEFREHQSWDQDDESAQPVVFQQKVIPAALEAIIFNEPHGLMHIFVEKERTRLK